MNIKLKSNKYGTIKRSALLKLAQQGLLEGKCNFRLTDDYAYDNASGFGRTEWLPVRIRPSDENPRQYPERVISFDVDDFSSRYKTGGARYDAATGLISFSIHSNLNYSLRVRS